MVTNFEEITQNLTPAELKIIPSLIRGFQQHTINNPIKNDEIIAAMNTFFEAQQYKIRMNSARLRKCVNYIRVNSIIPLIATSNGYFVSHDPKVINSQIRSLNERAASIRKCAEGLEKFKA